MVHFIQKEFCADGMLPGVGTVDPLDFLFGNIDRNQLLQHGNTQTLLQRTDHNQIRNMDSIVFFLLRFRHDLIADVVVHSCCRNNLILL